MPWTFDEIDSKYLAGGRLAHPADEIVTAFNFAEEILGGDWIESNYVFDGSKIRGVVPTLEIVRVGKQLRALDGVLRANKLVNAIIEGKRYSLSELTALHLLRGPRKDIQAEMYPPVHKGEADLRIRWDDDPWVYIEVTMQDDSRDQRRLQGMMMGFVKIVNQLNRSFSLEILLGREPAEDELQDISDRLVHFCSLDPPQYIELPNGLGTLLLKRDKTDLDEFRDYYREEFVPGLFMSHAIYGENRPAHHISIQVGFTDDRAEAVLKKEARQLPKDEPGLVMVDMSRTPASLRDWEPLLLRRLQPEQHTRVSAVCMWKSDIRTSEQGMLHHIRPRLVVNPHSRHPLPAWICETLEGSTELS